MVKSFHEYDIDDLPINRFDILEAARLEIQLYYESPRGNYELGLMKRKNYVDVKEEEDYYIREFVTLKLTGKGRKLLSKINSVPGTFRATAKNAFWLFTDVEIAYLSRKFNFE